MRKLIPVVGLFILTLASLAQPALTMPLHVDEEDYAWSATYYGGKLAAWDWTVFGPDDLADPGWTPHTYWARTQPMGTRFFFAAALGLAGEPAAPPKGLAAVSDAAERGALLELPERALLVMRVAASLAAAVGLALVAARFGWSGFAAGVLFLAIPHVRDDLALGWAEGPLVLCLGLVVAAFGTRWLAPVIGLTTTVKLTGLGFWPLLLWPQATRLRPLAAFLSAFLLWSALTPPSWFHLGPFFLGPMLRQRLYENAVQATLTDRIGDFAIAGVFVAPRYLLPLELLAALALTATLPRLVDRYCHLKAPTLAAVWTWRLPGRFAPRPMRVGRRPSTFEVRHAR